MGRSKGYNPVSAGSWGILVTTWALRTRVVDCSPGNQLVSKEQTLLRGKEQWGSMTAILKMQVPAGASIRTGTGTGYPFCGLAANGHGCQLRAIKHVWPSHKCTNNPKILRKAVTKSNDSLIT